MLRRVLLVAALAGIVSSARAGSILEPLQSAAEVPLTELVLPASEFGLLRFAVCEKCEAKSVLLSGDTAYVVNNRPVSFADFAAAVTRAQAATEVARRSIVGVFFDAESKGVDSVVLITPIP